MTEAEGAAAILRLVGDADEPLTGEEIERCIRWLEEARTTAALLDLWEAGKISLRWQHGGPYFRERR